MRLHLPGETYRRLNEMLDAAIDGTFVEQDYNESELSRLEAKWKRYLTRAAASKQNLEQEREVLKGLVSDISHQTRTPLSNIKLYAELLEERTEDAQSRELLRRLSVQTGRLEFLIQSLVKMSRLETGTIWVETKPGNLWKLAEAARLQAGEKAAAKDVALRLTGEQNASAYYDGKWTLEAVYNVVDNAVKYSPRGSEVEITCGTYELFSYIRVSDRGIGISEEEAAQIFTRFYRSPRVQAEEGIGIGLYLARQILSQGGGFLKAMPRPGGGSVFTIYLPRDKKEEPGESQIYNRTMK